MNEYSLLRKIITIQLKKVIFYLTPDKLNNLVSIDNLNNNLFIKSVKTDLCSMNHF
ncbi:MAG: hypothetical protein K0Q49_250 [Haloplasmataceae bacterium]|jgi:hypothetical protein|nr:hypothetical protein [Haloplasmataceae bacterium]